MPAIATTDAFGLFTKKLIAIHKERVKPNLFLGSYFPDVEVPTLEVSIEVQRGKEKVAVDVHRGDLGNRNQWTKSTEKIFIPPYFREWFDATKLQLYDRLYGATSIEDAVFAALINDVAEHQQELVDKILRAIELMRAQILDDGVVSGAAGGTGFEIDFQRRAEMLVDLGSGQYFSDNIDPFAKYKAGADKLRQYGKVTDMVIDAIHGEDAIADLFNNTKFKERQNLFNMSIDSVGGPQVNAEGGVYHGRISAGPYTVNLWTYPEKYEATGGTWTNYINAKKVIMLPRKPNFKTAYAAVPQVIEPGAMPKMGKMIFTDNVDKEKRAHKYEVESCPVPVPVAIDQIYTMQVKA